jgi:putative transcriptional regulator
MPVRVTLDALIVKKGLKARDLAAEVGLSRDPAVAVPIGQGEGHPLPHPGAAVRGAGLPPGDLLDYGFDAADLHQPTTSRRTEPPRRAAIVCPQTGRDARDRYRRHLRRRARRRRRLSERQ